MCGRYLTPDEAALERHWNVAAPGGYSRSWNVAPSQQAPVIVATADGAVCAALYTWGFRPAWAKRSWINARSESVFTSNAFARDARAHRCLVAAAGWYEWQGDAQPKQPYVHFARGFEPIALAGIWAATKHQDEWRRTFAILTRPATRALSFVHDRMPAVIEPADYAAWLAPNTPRDLLESMLTAREPAIESRRISTFVNKPANDDARCIEPLIGDED